MKNEENTDAGSAYKLAVEGIAYSLASAYPPGTRYAGCRILNVMVESNHGGLDEPFARKAAQALREYADAVDRGESGQHDVLRFVASNGCVVKCIAGRNAEPPRLTSPHRSDA